MKKGEIWIVALPGSGGHEQGGLRPAIVIADTGATVAVVIPCTSNPHARRFPHTFAIEASKKNGLVIPTVALILQIRAVDKKRLQKKIGVIEPSLLARIDATLRELLSL